MTFQIIVLIISIIICFINSLIDLKTKYLYNFGHILATIAIGTLFALDPEKITFELIAAFIFSISIFAALYLFHIFAIGDLKFGFPITIIAIYINPEAIYYSISIMLFAISAGYLILKAASKKIAFPAGLIIFASFAAGLSIIHI